MRAVRNYIIFEFLAHFGVRYYGRRHWYLSGLVESGFGTGSGRSQKPQIYYPPEVRRGEYLGLGVFLSQYYCIMIA